MERIPTELIVEKGQVFTTDKPMPVEPERDFDKHGTATEFVFKIQYEQYQLNLESWKKEAYPVTNQSLIVERFPNLYSKIGIDSLRSETNIYDAPAGLVFEVKDVCNAFIPQGIEIAKSRAESGCTLCHGNCDEKKQVAILSFKEASKETEMTTGKLCNECGKTMCENFINHGSCGDVPDWTSLAYQPDHKFFKDNITSDGKISITPVTKEPSSERPDFEKMAEEIREAMLIISEFIDGHLETSYLKNAWNLLSENVSKIDELQSLEQEIERLREESKH